MKTNQTKHPRDKFITVYGRKPVLEALSNPDIIIDKLLIANNARGEFIDEIVKQAKQRGVKISRESPKYITRISRNGRHDQGVVVDVIPPAMEALSTYLEREQSHPPNQKPQTCKFLALDGVKNPSNVGMIIRTCLAAGFDGIILPRKGCPDLNPLVIKASAGTAFYTRVLRCAELSEALQQLRQANYTIYGLSGTATSTLYNLSFSPFSVFVLGNETEGIHSDHHQLIDTWVSIPINSPAESLNVASAAAVVCFELKRQHLEQRSSNRNSINL
jgi:23S rRNA (guanosine2251-2'-O)-methyltransferase